MNSSKTYTAPHKIRSLSEIPPKFRRIFCKYETFNKVQSQVLDKVLHTDESIVIGAPTGSGKTAIFELAIVRLLMKMEELGTGEDFKIVYVAPVKALCMEKFADWREKFESPAIGLKCLSATGDCDVTNFGSLETAQLIVTTPEKWDSLTRKWKDAESMVEAVKLFIIDEVHLLNEDGRGPTLEAIVSRMKTVQYSMNVRRTGRNGTGLRFVAASATIPNIEDLAAWLGDETPASYYHASESLRPVQLQKHVIGFSTNAQGFRFDMNLNYKLSQIIRKYSNNKPTLIFCSTRKSVEMATQVLAGESSLMSSLSDTHKVELHEISRRIHDSKLKQLVLKGIAYHHAGLNYEDRAAVEDAFRKSYILILVCTSSLAMGVNFPAHLVIVKSTANYVCGKCQEYTESAILQMIGRAGRPQYDLHGVAVIMTQQKNVKKYENLVNGCTPVESHLQKHLAEHLNSEIVLQTVTDLTVAMKWIRSTFLYVRAVKCPANYGFAHGMPRDDVEKKLEEICIFHINALERCGLIVKDQTFGLSMASTSIGRLMARYYVSFDTIKVFWQLQGNESFLEVFNTLTCCKEFSDFTLRMNEKRTLNTINDHPIRFPIKGKIKTNENKISCLIQAVFDNIAIQDLSMTQDAYRMIRIGEKLSKCLSEYIRLTESQLFGKIYKTFACSLIIAKCFRAKLWNNSFFVSKQLKNIGETYSTRLVNAGKTTIESILGTDPRQIEMILGKAPPFGDEIIDALSAFPKYDLKLTRKGHNFLEITIKQCNENFIYDGQNATLVIGDANNNLLFHHSKIDETICEEGIFQKIVSIKNEETVFIQAKLIHEHLVGVDKEEKLILNPEVELVEPPKRSRRKIQTRLRTKTIQRKNYKNMSPESSKKDEKLFKSLLDDDDEFNDFGLAELEESFAESKAKVDEHRLSEVAQPTNLLEDKQSSIVEQLSSRTPIKRPFVSFERILPSKLPKTDHISIDCSKQNSTLSSTNRQEIIESISGEDTSKSNDCSVDNEILQQIFQNNCELEEEFINSQMMRDGNREVEFNKECEALDLIIHSNLEHNNSLSTSREEMNDSFGLNENSEVRKAKVDSMMVPCEPAKKIVQSRQPNTETCSLSKHSIISPVIPEIISKYSSDNVSSTLTTLQSHNSTVDSGIGTEKLVKTTSPVKAKKRLNLEKLRNFLLNPAKKMKKTSLTQAGNNDLCKKEDLQKFSRSCYFKVRPLAPLAVAEISSQPIPELRAPMSNTGKCGDGSRSNKCPDFFGVDKTINLPPKPGSMSIYHKICEKYLGKENLNLKTKEFLSKLETELTSTNDDISLDEHGDHNKEEFFGESDKPIQNKCNVTSIPTTSNVEATNEVLKFRSAFHQPIHNRILKLDFKQNMPANRSSVSCTNHENNRIDQLLHKVAQQPIKPILPYPDDRYRMKLPQTRWKNGQQVDFKPNNSFSGKCYPKIDVDMLSRSFGMNRRNTANLNSSSAQCSGEKRMKLDPENATLNIASLPKPDFETIEKERARRQISKEIELNETKTISYSPVYSVIVEGKDISRETNAGFEVMFGKQVDTNHQSSRVEPICMITQANAVAKVEPDLMVEDRIGEDVGFMSYDQIKQEERQSQSDDVIELLTPSPNRLSLPMGLQDELEIEIFSPFQCGVFEY